jgi:hypothetical protein
LKPHITVKQTLLGVQKMLKDELTSTALLQEQLRVVHQEGESILLQLQEKAHDPSLIFSNHNQENRGIKVHSTNFTLPTSCPREQSSCSDHNFCFFSPISSFSQMCNPQFASLSSEGLC